jgi:uncharacterized membrane protein YdbT with pleckstrin-like domain
MTDTMPSGSTATAEIVYDRQPVMFGDKPVLFVVLLLLIPVVIGAVALIAWYFGTLANRLTVDSRKIRHRQGLLSKRVKEIAIAKVRSIEVDQTFVQRMTDVGKVRIFTTGDVPEIVLGGLPRPYAIKAAITELGGDA